MSSPRSYLPMAWAVTRFCMASDKSRREKPALRLASLIRSAIMAALLRFTIALFTYLL